MTVHLKKPLAEGLPLWLCFGLFGKRSQVAQVTSNLLCGRNSPELQTPASPSQALWLQTGTAALGSLNRG